jgi:hypothetical protein
VDRTRGRQIATAPNVVAFECDPRNGDVLPASLGDSHLLRLVPKPAAKRRRPGRV